MENRGIIALDLNIMLGPYKCNMQTAVDCHGYSMQCGNLLLLSIAEDKCSTAMPTELRNVISVTLQLHIYYRTN